LYATGRRRRGKSSTREKRGIRAGASWRCGSLRTRKKSLLLLPGRKKRPLKKEQEGSITAQIGRKKRNPLASLRMLQGGRRKAEYSIACSKAGDAGIIELVEKITRNKGKGERRGREVACAACWSKGQERPPRARPRGGS